MEQMNRGNRPLSPFMLGQVYRPQITSVMSILHRITGVGLTLGALLLVWWFLAAAAGPEAFARADGVLTSWFGGLVLIFSLLALWYHFANGIRHLLWDAGWGFELERVRMTGIAVAVATPVLTLVTLVAAFWS